MKFQEREKIILELLQEKQVVRVEELSELLQVSLVTVRKDLRLLESEGKLLRTFGGVTACAVESKEQQRREMMQRIAKRTAEEIEEGDFFIMNAGTTAMLTAWELRKKQVKVITNAISVAREIKRHSGSEAILLGGELTRDAVFTHGSEAIEQLKQYKADKHAISVAREIKRHSGSEAILLGGELTRDAVFTHGSEAIEQLKQYKADKLVLSISGISCKGGITTRHMEAAGLFRGMIACASEVIVVADSTKIGFESFYHVSGLNVVDKLITDADPEHEEELQRMEAMGVRVLRCRNEEQDDL